MYSVQQADVIESSKFEESTRRTRAIYPNQTKNHQPNHHSPNDNPTNLNATFQRTTAPTKYKPIRRNVRSNENQYAHYPNFVPFEPFDTYQSNYHKNGYHGKHFDRNDKQLSRPFDSGNRIDRTLIDRILKDKQQLINKQLNKQFDRKQIDKQIDRPNDKQIDEANGSQLNEKLNDKNQIDETIHKQPDQQVIQLSTDERKAIPHNHTTDSPKFNPIDVNSKIDTSQLSQMNGDHKMESKSKIAPNCVKVNLSSLNGSLNRSLNKSLNRPLNKSINKSSAKQLTNGLVHKSPAGTGQQLNGYCMPVNDFSHLIGNQLINAGPLQANINLLNCSMNSNAVANLNTNSSKLNQSLSTNSNSSLSTILSTSLSAGNPNANQLYKMLLNAQIECNNSLNSEHLNALNSNLNKLNQQVNHQINCPNQLLNNQLVECPTTQAVQLLNNQPIRSHHIEPGVNEQLVSKVNDVLISDPNGLQKKNFKNDSNNELKSDPKGDLKNEFKNGKKNKRMPNDANPFRNQFPKENNHQFNHHEIKSQANHQVNTQINDQINNQVEDQVDNQMNNQPSTKKSNNQNSKSISTTNTKQMKSEIKNNESEKYSYKKTSNHHNSNHHFQNPFFKPPKYQDRIMSPDSFTFKDNWKRKGSFNKHYNDKKFSNQNKPNNPNFGTPIVPYPKLIHSYHDIVSNQIWKLYILLRQTPESYDRKITLRQALYKALKDDLVHDLYMVGSSLNGLGTITSDVDMCLLLPQKYGDIDQTTQAVPILRLVKDIIAKKLDFIDNIRLIEAKVPILKFSDKKGNIEIDLNINNIVGIRNTQLVKCYTRLDWRMTPLAIAIKAWAHFNQINNAHQKTISSYTLVLMLIHYLQVDCSPPILPCLHSLMPNSFRTDSNVKELNLFEDLPEFRSDNGQSLSELFIGFLDYYGNRFDYGSDVISVRVGRIMKKEVAREYRSPKNTSTQWHFICCEEPFDRTNTARSVSDFESFKRVTKVFQNSYCRLKQTHNLVSILNLEHLFGLNGGLSNIDSDLNILKTSNQSIK